MRSFLTPAQPISEELQVLREELESKILENERLVIASSELQSAFREMETRCESAEFEIRNFTEKLENLSLQLTQARQTSESLATAKQRAEIRADSLARELELLNHVLLENAELRKKEVSQLHSKVAAAEQQLAIAQTCQHTSVQELIQEKAQRENLALQMDQLTEQVAVLKIANQQQPISPPVDRNCSTGSCCYRAEYYQCRCRNLEALLRQ